jgi:hypothetical protein
LATRMSSIHGSLYSLLSVSWAATWAWHCGRCSSPICRLASSTDCPMVWTSCRRAGRWIPRMLRGSHYWPKLPNVICGVVLLVYCVIAVASMSFAFGSRISPTLRWCYRAGMLYPCRDGVGHMDRVARLRRVRSGVVDVSTLHSEPVRWVGVQGRRTGARVGTAVRLRGRLIAGSAGPRNRRYSEACDSACEPHCHSDETPPLAPRRSPLAMSGAGPRRRCSSVRAFGRELLWQKSAATMSLGRSLYGLRRRRAMVPNRCWSRLRSARCRSVRAGKWSINGGKHGRCLRRPPQRWLQPCDRARERRHRSHTSHHSCGSDACFPYPWRISPARGQQGGPGLLMGCSTRDAAICWTGPSRMTSTCQPSLTNTITK